MNDRSRVRLVIVQVLVLSLFAALGARLWYLQIATGDRYAQAASENRLREVSLSAVRGSIVDQAGRALVRNRTAVTVTADRTTLREQSDDGSAVLHRLATVLGLPYATVALRTTLCAKGVPRGCWNGSPYAPMVVTDSADESVLLKITERREDFAGISADVAPVREFPAPDGANAAHLLGYLSPVTSDELSAAKGALTDQDLVGRSGLEREYDTALRGSDGTRTVSVDHRGEVTGTVGTDQPTDGGTLVTSIDAGVQAVAERQLQAALLRARTQRDSSGRPYAGDSGSVVVMDHTNGRIVAMASAPTFDPSIWVGGISAADYAKLTAPSAGTPSLFRATQGLSVPASTFKAISTSAALMSGYSTDDRFDCSSSFKVGNRTFDNYESESFGPITLQRALQVSCDTVFYRIAYDMWLKDGGDKAGSDAKDPMVTMAEAFGLGTRTGVDLPGESSGRIADRAWKLANWQRTKDTSCRRAKTGYPEVAATDAPRAAYLKQIASDNCTDGFKFRAGDAVNFSIGQGDTAVTPLQMAVVYSAVAQGGVLWSPRIGKAVLSPTGQVVQRITAPVAGHVPVSPQALAYVRDSLYTVTTSGTGRAPFAGFPLDTHPVASKTGTGEVYGKQSTSWFASFDDRYTIVMTVSQGGTGSGTSGPSVRAIYDAIYGLEGHQALLPGGVEPDAVPRLPGTTATATSAPAVPVSTASPAPVALGEVRGRRR